MLATNTTRSRASRLQYLEPPVTHQTRHINKLVSPAAKQTDRLNSFGTRPYPRFKTDISGRFVNQSETSESRSETPGKFLNVLLQKDGEDQLD